ncbi:MAG: hypothetical protein ACI4OW_02570 [Alphaproteobacteria bacterium]
MIKLVKENWNVRSITVVDIEKTVWVIHSVTGRSLQLPEQFCHGKPPRKKLWNRYHKVTLDKIGPYVVGVTINKKRIYLLEEAQYPYPVALYAQDTEKQMKNLLIALSPVTADDVAELPAFMNIRHNFMRETLPKEEIWQKRMALELIMHRAIQKICFRHVFQSQSDIENTSEEEIRKTLVEVGFPAKDYDKVLDICVYETKYMLRAYVEDCWLAAVSIDKAFENSKFLPYANSFVPVDISLNQIKSYISLISM